MRTCMILAAGAFHIVQTSARLRRVAIVVENGEQSTFHGRLQKIEFGCIEKVRKMFMSQTKRLDGRTCNG